MKRILYVKNGIVQNVVGFEDDAEVPQRDVGCDLVLDPTGRTHVGDVHDMRDIALDRVDALIFGELLRLTNAMRAAQVPPLVAFSAAQYRAFLKSRMT